MHLEELKARAKHVINVLPYPQACLLPLIRLIALEGELTEDMQAALAEICDVPLDQVHEIVLAFQQPGASRGAFRVCGGLICVLSRAPEVFAALQASGLPTVLTDCFGYCHAAPAVQKPDGKFYKAQLSQALKQGDSPGNAVLEIMSGSRHSQGGQE
jgi:NADH:ubiquinone oxidoreductase subunit E